MASGMLASIHGCAAFHPSNFMARTTTRNSVLRVLRRGSKDAAGQGRFGSQVSSHSQEPRTIVASGLGLFHLPAELRNLIYEYVICDAVLTLPATTSRLAWSSRRGIRRNSQTPAPAPAPLNGLLLASKRSRQEYLTILWSAVEVNVEVKDFDFEHLMQASSRLGPSELTGLRSNPNLTISLQTQNCTTKALLSLRKWLEFRESHNDGLLWTYKYPLDQLLPAHSMGRIRLLRELEYYQYHITKVVPEIDLSQQYELNLIFAAFETDIQWLKNDVGQLEQRTTEAARNVRGLAGGGLR